jgi:histidinol-phosphate phosphatase family protein
MGGKVSDMIPTVERAILDGKSVAIDNTNLVKEARALFIQLAKRHHLPVIGYYFNTTIEDCQIRHVRRMYQKFGKIYFEGKGINDPHCFEPVVFFNARKRLEVPSKEEGFTELHVVDVPSPIDYFSASNGYVNKALFLDIDGTIRETEHLTHKYPVRESEVTLLKDVDLMRKRLDDYRKKGFQLIGVSNQSGIAKGTVTKDQVERCFARTRELLGYTEDEFPILYCPHRSVPISCYCRKPQTGMIMDCVLKMKLDPRKCLMVGDRTTDQTFATRAGVPYLNVTQFW